MKLTFPLFIIAFLLLSGIGCTHQHVIGYTGTAAPANGASAAATTTPRSDLEGIWDYKMTGADLQPLSGALTIRRNGSATSGYAGHITVTELDIDADTDIATAEISGQNFTYEGRIQTGVGPIPFSLTGIMQGRSFNGQGEVRLPQGNSVYKITATRR